jgi:hypothetical protein
MNEPKYSIQVFEDHALITGFLSADILKLIISLCQKEGFTHLSFSDVGQQGFKLIKEKND